MDEFVTLLGEEQRLLDVLAFRLTVLRQLLVLGEARFLAWATDDVARAMHEVRAVELRRAVHVAGMAAERGVPADTLTLGQLIERAAVPWRGILAEHQATLAATAAEIDDHASAIRRLARSGGATVLDVLARLSQRTDDETELARP